MSMSRPSLTWRNERRRQAEHRTSLCSTRLSDHPVHLQLGSLVLRSRGCKVQEPFREVESAGARWRCPSTKNRPSESLGGEPRVCESGTVKTYWVITVRDPGDHEARISRYERRFEFDDLERAYECALGAHKAGFEVSAAKVSATRGRGSDRGSRERSNRNFPEVRSVGPLLPPVDTASTGRRAHRAPF
jgi:hypothetical protein